MKEISHHGMDWRLATAAVICLTASLNLGCNEKSSTASNSGNGTNSVSSTASTASPPANLPPDAQAQIQKGMQQGKATGAAYADRMNALGKKK